MKNIKFWSRRFGLCFKFHTSSWKSNRLKWEFNVAILCQTYYVIHRIALYRAIETVHNQLFVTLEEVQNYKKNLISMTYTKTMDNCTHYIQLQSMLMFYDITKRSVFINFRQQKRRLQKYDLKFYEKPLERTNTHFRCTYMFFSDKSQWSNYNS